MHPELQERSRKYRTFVEAESSEGTGLGLLGLGMFVLMLSLFNIMRRHMFGEYQWGFLDFITAITIMLGIMVLAKGFGEYRQHDQVLSKMLRLEAGLSLLNRGTILYRERQSLIDLEAAMLQVRCNLFHPVNLGPLNDHFDQRLREYTRQAATLSAEQAELSGTIRQLLGLKTPRDDEEQISQTRTSE